MRLPAPAVARSPAQQASHGKRLQPRSSLPSPPVLQGLVSLLAPHAAQLCVPRQQPAVGAPQVQRLLLLASHHAARSAVRCSCSCSCSSCRCWRCPCCLCPAPVVTFELLQLVRGAVAELAVAVGLQVDVARCTGCCHLEQHQAPEGCCRAPALCEGQARGQVSGMPMVAA